MKWVNHEIITGSLVYAFSGGNLACTGAALGGALIPDIIEGRPPAGDEHPEKARKWRKHHRALSHWFVPYSLAVIVTVIASFLAPEKIYLLGPAGWFLAGCIFHIGEDALCGYVPSLNPAQRIGTRLFHMGSPKEYLISFGILGSISAAVMFS